MSVDLKKVDMKSRTNLWVYGVATLSSFVNIFLSSTLMEKVAWACSFIWAVSAWMLQIRVNELQDDNLGMYIDKEINRLTDETDVKK